MLYLPVPLDRSAAGLALLNQASVVYGTTLHHRPTPNGYAGFFPPSFFSLGGRVKDLPDERSLDFLRGLDVGFVVLAADAGPWSALRDPDRARPLELLAEVDGDLLYRVPPRAS